MHIVAYVALSTVFSVTNLYLQCIPAMQEVGEMGESPPFAGGSVGAASRLGWTALLPGRCACPGAHGLGCVATGCPASLLTACMQATAATKTGRSTTSEQVQQGPSAGIRACR